MFGQAPTIRRLGRCRSRDEMEKSKSVVEEEQSPVREWLRVRQ